MYWMKVTDSGPDGAQPLLARTAVFAPSVRQEVQKVGDGLPLSREKAGSMATLSLKAKGSLHAGCLQGTGTAGPPQRWAPSS